MYKEDPALGESAGLVRGREVFRTETTAKASGKFPSTTSSLYEQIIADRHRRVILRTPLDCKATMLLFIQRSEICRCLRMRLKDGKPIDVDRALLALAWIIRALSGPCIVQHRDMKEPQRRDHPVLSRQELARWANCAGLQTITDADLQRAEIAACRAPRNRFPHALLGSLLRLTAAERDRCQFWLAEAIDETPAQRRERKAIEKRGRDKIAKAARDQAKRQLGERRTRDQYRAACAAQREQDEATCRLHGISKRTLRHWKQTGNPLCQSVVADIGRSPTSSETPIIERPHFGKAGDGMCPTANEGRAASGKAVRNQRENRLTWHRSGQNEPPCRVIEPEPTAKPSDSALALLRNKGVSDGRSLAKGVESPSAGVRHWLQLLNATDTDYRDGGLERHRRAA